MVKDKCGTVDDRYTILGFDKLEIDGRWWLMVIDTTDADMKQRLKCA